MPVRGRTKGISAIMVPSQVTPLSKGIHGWLKTSRRLRDGWDQGTIDWELIDILRRAVTCLVSAYTPAFSASTDQSCSSYWLFRRLGDGHERLCVISSNVSHPFWCDNALLQTAVELKSFDSLDNH
jgi:hypothetical protein